MKKTFALSLLLISLISCDEGIQKTNLSRVQGIMQEGTWRISYFYDTNVDETAIYSNYTFEFDQSAILAATDGTNSFSGTWRIIDNNQLLDLDDLTDLSFNILFAAPPSFAKLAGNWSIIEITETKVKLTTTDITTGTIDYLTFDRK